MRVLVVDDEFEVCDVTAKMLEALGHTAVRCLSGEEALQRMVDDPYDLLIADINMPGMNGVDLIATTIALGYLPKRRTVALTGLDFEHKAVQRLTAEKIFVLFKPFELSALRWALEAIAAA